MERVLNHLPVECVGAAVFDGNLHSLFAAHYLQSCALKHSAGTHRQWQHRTDPTGTTTQPDISFLSGSHVQEQPPGFHLKATSHLIEHSAA